MKHFWVFTFVSILIAAFFGGFTFPEKGYAQETSTNSVQGDLDKGIGLFTTQLQLFENKDLVTKLGEPSVNALIKEVKYGQSIFIGLYNAEIKSGSKPADAFKTALNSVQYTISILGENGKYGESSLILSSNEKNLLNGTKEKDILASFTNILGIAQPGDNKEITPGSSNKAITNAQTAAGTTVKEAAGKSCSLLGNSSIIDCIDIGFTWFLKSIVLNIVGFFLWMSANLLNFAMYHGIFEFKKFAPDEIYSIWLVVRQIISLFVFFTGLFVGFMAIIGKSEEFKKYIAFLVVFGLFVNFSYPIVRVFVDISNVVSLQIYQTTLGKEVLAENPSSDSNAGEKIMNSMGLQGLVSKATSLADQNKSNQFLDQVSSTPGALAVVGFVGYAAYIFFMAAFLIIVRTALLVCIIIASPILLMDTIVPALGEKAKWLRGMFVSQLFVAPVFTIMLALTLKFLAIFSSVSGTSGASATSTLNTGASASSVTVFFNLIMMLVMLHIMLKVTKAVAGGVGDTVTNWAGKAGGLGTGLALGAGGMALGAVGRNTAGRFAKNLGEKDWGGGRLGNFAKDTFQNMGKRSYDLRNLGATSAIAGTLGITGMGQGSKESYAKNREEYEKQALERAGEIKDDGQREEYLNRKFNQTGAGKFVDKVSFGSNANSKAYKSFVKGDEDVMKQYVNASDKDKAKMREDEKNKKYLQRFGNVDKVITNPNDTDAKGKLSPETQKAIEDRERRITAEKARNESRVASYLTADQSTRENILANAIKAGDDKLIKQLQTMDSLRGRDLKTIETADLAGLNDPALADKVLAQTRSFVEAQDVIKEARLSSSPKVLKDSANQMTEAVNKMMEKNNDLASLLRDIMQNNVSSNNTTSQTTAKKTGPISQPQAQAQAQATPV